MTTPGSSRLDARAIACLVALGLGGGCKSSAHVTLAPTSGACGMVASGATGLTVTALADSGATTIAIALGSAVELADLPSDTAQLAVEVLGANGTAVAIGKTAPLAFDDLGAGATIPIFMAPPDGFCPAGELVTPRIAPSIARAGSGALVIGGTDSSGSALGTAEYFDPATATFTTVEVPEALADDGFIGVALATLPDGRVAVTGGANRAFAIFDPASLASQPFGDPVLIDDRAFHSAYAIDDDHVLLAGGCHGVTAGACAPPATRGAELYALDDLVAPTIGPGLSGDRIGATMFDLGTQLDGTHPYMIAGGSGDPGGDRFAITDDQAIALVGGNAQAAQLDGGGVLTAFGSDDAAPAIGATAAFTPAGATRVLATAAARTGVRVIALEDGTVLAVGGDGSGALAQYVPTTDSWEQIVPAGDGPGAIAAPSLIRLDDGTVLVVGGTTIGAAPAVASASAWIFRPALDGPYEASAIAMPAGGQGAAITPTDPATVTRGAGWVLGVPTAGTAGDGDDTARALVGGARMITGTVSAIARVQAGGLALVAQQVSAGELVLARLDPGVPSTIARLAGTSSTICTGSVPPAFDPSVAVTAALAIGGTTATLTVDGIGLASCDLGTGVRGAWGIAAAGAGAALDVEAVTLQR